jgi:putative component of membrane protein insertase Oxa1/YidC/SpoIIIJ protein YidD
LLTFTKKYQALFASRHGTVCRFTGATSQAAEKLNQGAL